jgi:hypothetical protein
MSPDIASYKGKKSQVSFHKLGRFILRAMLRLHTTLRLRL